MKVLIILGVVALAFAGKRCGKNQHYNSCGTTCPITCHNKDDGPRPCIFLCNPGCHCDAGYVRNDENVCIRPEKCLAKSKHVCGQNEWFNECGTSCPLTCENYQNPPKICNFMCNVRCECEEGYVRSRDGRCIQPFNCPVNNERDICELPAEAGICFAYIPRFYFNMNSSQCERFIYGGCRGNENNFVTEEDCRNRCGPFPKVDVCELPAEAGICEAYMPRFYFNKNSRQCERFIYGGCRGNENNFATEEHCRNRCGGAFFRQTNSACQLEKVVCPCRAAFRRYFYNKATGECEEFIYGGCRGNANNFQTLNECRNACKVLPSMIRS